MSREWANSICGCFANIPWCCITVFCPCATSYNVGTRIGLTCMAITSVIIWIAFHLCGYLLGVSGTKAEFDWESYKTIDGDQIKDDPWSVAVAIADICMLIFILLFIFIVYRMRVHMRKSYDLEGGCCTDCLWGCICWPLSLCQMKNHIEYEGVHVTRA